MADGPLRLLGRTPMTDPRSIGGSLAFHGLMMLVASLAVLGAAGSGRTDPPRALRGELDPVDNLAPAVDGGGSPGALGGTGALAPGVELVAEEGYTGPDAAADALLSEVLPKFAAPDAPALDLPGPDLSGVGILPGPGLGGGGGSGGGSGGGTGRGLGPGTQFLGARDNAWSFAYVIDCSGSMLSRRSLEMAKRELMASLGQLPPDAQFAVVFYNLRARVMPDARGRVGLMPATAENKERVATLMTTISAIGGTDHMLALRTALQLRPEVIFFLSDGDMMTERDAAEIRSELGGVRIQAIEFGLGASITRRAGPLEKLAVDSGGNYRYVDTKQFPDLLR